MATRAAAITASENQETEAEYTRPTTTTVARSSTTASVTRKGRTGEGAARAARTSTPNAIATSVGIAMPHPSTASVPRSATT